MNWPKFSKKEISVVRKIMQSGRVNYWTGNECKNFEKEYSKFFNVNYSVAVCNATVGLEAALRVLNIGKGDEVITTPRSYNASASCILRVGAEPVFADIELDTQNISPQEIKNRITKKTKAIICVHLGGMPCNMISIKKVLKGKKIFVIEDCSQAHGAKIKNKFVGQFSDIAVWSFCNDKIISTLGEGGMISTNSKEIYHKLWSYKEIGKDYKKSKTNFVPNFKFLHDHKGTNLRMTEVQAAVGRIQLKGLDNVIKKRNQVSSKITQTLNRTEVFETFPSKKNYTNAFYRLYFLIRPQFLKKKNDRSKIINWLRKCGIKASVGSCPEIYKEKLFVKRFKKKFSLQNAKYIGSHCIALEINHNLNNKYIKMVCLKLKMINEKIIST